MLLGPKRFLSYLHVQLQPSDAIEDHIFYATCYSTLSIYATWARPFFILLQLHPRYATGGPDSFMFQLQVYHWRATGGRLLLSRLHSIPDMQLVARLFFLSPSHVHLNTQLRSTHVSPTCNSSYTTDNQLGAGGGGGWLFVLLASPPLVHNWSRRPSGLRKTIKG